VADSQFGSVSAAEVRHPVVVVVPGVGFDARGVRLGRGAGFYDRALADLRRAGLVYAVGVAFECQIVPALPAEAWDERVDWVVTEQRVIGCAERRAGVAEAAR
jgi:5-formyltetrahydrofolate cyclo-ligase